MARAITFAALMLGLISGCGGDAEGPEESPSNTEVHAHPTSSDSEGTASPTMSVDNTPEYESPTFQQTPGENYGTPPYITSTPPCMGVEDCLSTATPLPGSTLIPGGGGENTPTDVNTAVVGEAQLYYYLDGALLGKEQGVVVTYDVETDHLEIHIPEDAHLELDVSSYSLSSAGSYECDAFSERLRTVLTLPGRDGEIELPEAWQGQVYENCVPQATLDDVTSTLIFDSVGEFFRGSYASTLVGTGSREGQTLSVLMGFEAHIPNAPDPPAPTPAHNNWSLTTVYRDGFVVDTSDALEIAWTSNKLDLRFGQDYEQYLSIIDGEIEEGVFQCGEFEAAEPAAFMKRMSAPEPDNLCQEDLTGRLEMLEVGGVLSGNFLTIGENAFSGEGEGHQLLIETSFGVKVPAKP